MLKYIQGFGAVIAGAVVFALIMGFTVWATPTDNPLRWLGLAVAFFTGAGIVFWGNTGKPSGS